MASATRIAYPTLTVSRHSVIQTLHQWRCDILLPRAALNLWMIYYHFQPRGTSSGWPLHTCPTLTVSRHSVIQTLHKWRCDILLPRAMVNLWIIHCRFRRFLLAYVSTTKMVFVFRTIRIPALETSRQNILIQATVGTFSGMWCEPKTLIEKRV